MAAANRDLFDELTNGSILQGYLGAFEAWLADREALGSIREPSSVAVYSSMWSALAAWCVARCLHIDALKADHLEAYLLSRGGTYELSARYAWRLLTLVDAVLAHRAKSHELAPNTAAVELLMSTPEWRFANSADKTPLPDYLHAQEARLLVAWLLDPAAGSSSAGAPAHSWQNLRNRSAVAMQLGAGLSPGDVRAATVGGVVCHGGKVHGMPWKIRLPEHGSSPAREAPVAPWAGRLLRTWLDTRCALQISGSSLFPASRSGRPWSKVAQYSAAKAVLLAAGLQDTDGGSFKLRHTFAMRQLRRGTPAEQIAQWMGLTDTAALARHRKVIFAPANVA